MELNKIKEFLSTYKKGSFVKIQYKSNIENASAKKQNISVEKYTNGSVRIGISYENIKKVKEQKAQAIANGFIPSEDKKETWFEHLGDQPMLVQNKTNPEKKYLQVFTSPNRGKVQYKLNGNLFDGGKEKLLSLGVVNPSKFDNKGKDELVVFNLPIENIISLG